MTIAHTVMSYLGDVRQGLIRADQIPAWVLEIGRSYICLNEYSTDEKGFLITVQVLFDEMLDRAVAEALQAAQFDRPARTRTQPRRYEDETWVPGSGVVGADRFDHDYNRGHGDLHTDGGPEYESDGDWADDDYSE